jgi:hypothetical protein|tara:strand:+ start:515 stop:709 length:195 start_codon:yes stop_codon:yes gene_type:complete
MYLNIGQGATPGLGNIGLFSDYTYWSSTEHSTIDCCGWKFDFTTGVGNQIGKGDMFYVRAIRAF